MNLRKSAEEILTALGGKENVEAATHCITRLRLVLKDEKMVDTKKLEQIDAVKGTFLANGQFQIVIGQGTVDKIYKEFVEVAEIGRSSKEDVKNVSAKKLNPLQRAIKTLADIFIPILPAIVTAGLLMGINNILTGVGIFYEDKALIDVHTQWKDFASMVNLIANTSFVFLPGLIGWSAVNKFGGNPLLGIVLGLMLVHPDLLNAWGYGAAKEIPKWDLFGFDVQKVGYQGQVLPVLIASYVLAKTEIFLKKRIPDAFQLLFVAPISLLFTGFLAFIAIGPVTFAIGNAITDGIVGIFDAMPLLGGLIYGALYAPLVITGMHHTFLAVDLQLIGSTGSTFLWVMVALSNIAQGTAALAMMFVTKDEKLKGLSFTSAVSAYLGITEPAMFGVNLRYRFAFISAIIGSSLAGAYVSVNAVKAQSVGIGGLPGFLSIIPQYWGAFFVGMAIVLIVPFVLTFVFAKLNTKKQK